jgi:hypothetical protein
MIPNTVIRFSLLAVVYHRAAMDLSSANVERVDAVFADIDLPQHPGAALLVIAWLGCC